MAVPKDDPMKATYRTQAEQHNHEWERGAHMAAAFGVDGRVLACAICGIPKERAAEPHQHRWLKEYVPNYRLPSEADWVCVCGASKEDGGTAADSIRAVLQETDNPHTALDVFERALAEAAAEAIATTVQQIRDRYEAEDMYAWEYSDSPPLGAPVSETKLLAILKDIERAAA